MKPNQFPPLLQEIPDKPKILYLEGILPDPKKFRYLTVVGSRKCSNYGRQVCQKLVSGLAGYPIAIVSGLAVGIDTAAHRAALESGLPAVGVPGSGLNRKVLYPSVNVGLADDIVAKGGALISEFEPETKAQLYTFPQRNRIMAGLSKAVLLVEAGEKSGTLITARLATDYNRDVLVVPGQIFSSGSQGVHQFLKLGATPVTSSEDILNVLGFDVSSETKQRINPDDLSAEEKQVYELLVVEPLERDILIRALDLDISKANILLGTMELKGLITESLGEVRLV